MSFFTCGEAIKILTENPDAFKINVTKNKNGTLKTYNDAAFHNITLAGKPFWVTATDIDITQSAAIPGDVKDKRNARKGMNLRVATTVTRSGKFGELIKLAHPIYLARLEDMDKNDNISLNGKSYPKDLAHLIQTQYKAEDGTMCNIADPGIKLKIDFDSNYAANHPISGVKGKPKTTFFQEEKVEFKKPNGEVVMVTKILEHNGFRITNGTFHNVVKDGGKLLECVIDLSSMSINAKIAWMPCLHLATVKIGKAIAPGGEAFRTLADLEAEFGAMKVTNPLDFKPVDHEAPANDNEVKEKPGATDAALEVAKALGMGK